MSSVLKMPPINKKKLSKSSSKKTKEKKVSVEELLQKGKL